MTSNFYLDGFSNASSTSTSMLQFFAMNHPVVTIKEDERGSLAEIALAIIFVASLLFAGYKIYDMNKSAGASAKTNTNTAGQQASEDKLDYPETYKRYKLPEYPAAKLVRVKSPQGSQAGELLNLTLETTKDVNEAGRFYENAFANLSNWKFIPPKTHSPTLYLAKAVDTSEDLTFQLTITTFSGKTNILIGLSNANASGE